MFEVDLNVRNEVKFLENSNVEFRKCVIITLRTVAKCELVIVSLWGIAGLDRIERKLVLKG